jgi:hypothetical protein
MTGTCAKKRWRVHEKPKVGSSGKLTQLKAPSCDMIQHRCFRLHPGGSCGGSIPIQERIICGCAKRRKGGVFVSMPFLYLCTRVVFGANI